MRALLIPLLLQSTVGDAVSSSSTHWCVRAWNDAPPYIFEQKCDFSWDASIVRKYALEQAARFMPAAVITREMTNKSITSLKGGEHYKDWYIRNGPRSYVLIFTYDDAQVPQQ